MFIPVVGKFPKHTSVALDSAIRKAGADCVFASSAEEALVSLHGARHECPCIFVKAGRAVQPLLERLGADIDYGTIPVIALTDFPSQESYLEALKLGVDDCTTESDTGGIFRRVANTIQGNPAKEAGPNAGRALVAIPEAASRRAVGRRLRCAGFDVDFALEEGELRAKSRSKVELSLIVAGESFPPIGAAAAIQLARSAADVGDIPAVVVPSRRAPGPDGRELTDSEIVNRLMFLVEEARVGSRGDNRASRRLQDSVICTFRSTRSFQPVYALTDNISREGLYLRTMDPPGQNSEVIIEMLSDQGEILHLKGIVAWRHAPARTGGAKPAGIGLRLDAEASAPADIAAYRKFYDSRLAAVCDAEAQMPRSIDQDRATMPAGSPKTQQVFNPSASR